MDLEEWKDIPGYNGEYQVSNLGRIKSWLKRAKGGVGLIGKIKSINTTSMKYPIVSLKGVNILVANIVADSFLPPRPTGMRLAYKDEDRFNCKAENLYWKDYTAERRRMLTGQLNLFDPV